MKAYNYTSGVGHLIKQFVNQKNAAGYPYESSALILLHFDQMISKHFPSAESITKEICDLWLKLKPNEHPNGRLRRVTPIRQLCKFLNGIGVNAYIIPGNIPSKTIRYQPHIYTDEELKAFFYNIDSMKKSPFAPFHHLIGPTIFRMIYCCGLRNSEARNLTVEDINLDTGKIIIRESKGWKSRVLYMSDSMTFQCRIYDEQMNKIMPNRTMFFPDKNGKCISNKSISLMFHNAWDATEESKQVIGNKPRIHDFRHSYAVKRINQWASEGVNLNAMYPYLSEYLGHCSYRDTDYYIHLTDEFYPILDTKMAQTNENVLPKIDTNEE